MHPFSRLKTLVRSGAVALAFVLWLGALADRAVAQTPTVTLDPAVRHQQFNGFGTGSIFYHGHLARGVPPGYVNSTYDLLFRQLDHKYLMFWLRPNEDPNDNAAPSTVNWSGFTFGEAQQDYVTVINAAKARDTNLVIIATVYTPPAWLKSNRSLYNGGTLDTTVPNAYEEFAEFVFANLHWFKQRGVVVSILAWMNEPDYTLSHEDSDFTAAQARDVHRYCVPQLQTLIASTQNTAGLQMPQIMGPQTLSVSTAASYVDTLKASPTAWSNTHYIATHQYGGSSIANFSNLVQKAAGKPVLMSEWHCANNDDIDPEDVEVVEQSRAICTALNGGVNGYLWFEANHPGNGFAGLIHLPWWDTDGPNLTRTYHSWRQWLSLTPQGAQRINARGENLPASVEGSVALHLTNSTNAVLHLVKSGTNVDALHLRVAGKLITRVEQWRTSASLGYARVLDSSFGAGTNRFATQLAGNQLSSYRLHFSTDPLLGTNGPLAFWRCDDGSGGVADDYTGHGFSGSLQNAPAWTNTPAGRRQLQFNTSKCPACPT
jgi:O-glycosyl hydrolase